MEFESYSDYPESAVNAAKRALAWAEKNGWGSCGTPVGKARANQLANREPISEETIARMASFARQLQNKDVPYSEGCGGLMVDAWGGQAGIEWAHNKLEKIREKFDFDPSGLPPYIEQAPKKKKTKMADDGDLSDACDEGYEAYGLKELNGRMVPNCVPIKAKKLRKVEKKSTFSSAKNDKITFAVEKDQQILIGAAMIPDLEIFRKDEDGNPYYVKFSKDTIAGIQQKFMAEMRNRETNLDHNDAVNGGSYVFESWLVEDPKTDKANTVYHLDVPVGTWMVKMKVTDPKVWADVKAGKYKGFSIEGNFIDKQDYDKIQDEKKALDQIMRILNS
jgi:hypothetical protein